MKRKFITFALALVMVVMAFSPAQAAYYKDTANHWAVNDINWATEQGFLKGDGNGLFRPEDPVTRAEYVTGVNRLVKAKVEAAIQFPDVAKSSWYYNELAKGVYAGLIDDSAYNFRPNEAIIREDAALILKRAYCLKDYPQAATVFKDADNITQKGAVGALVVKKVLNGWDDGNFYPYKNLTRAEYAKILRASVEYLGLPECSKLPTNNYNYYPNYPYYGGYYYCCNDELASLSSALTNGRAYLAKEADYTAESIAVLKTAVKDGQVVYDNYKNYSCSSYNYGYWGNSTDGNWTDFYNYMSKYTSYSYDQIKTIWENNYYNGYYGYDYWYGLSFKTYEDFKDYMHKNYPYKYTTSELYDMFYYGYSGYYGYYDYCPYKATIDSATKKINDAITRLKKKPVEETVTVKFHANEGTPAPEDVTLKKGETVSEPKDVERKGFKLVGWFTEPEFTNEWSFSSKVDKDLNLYAKWEAIEYLVEVTNLDDPATNFKVDKTKATKGETITVTPNPEKGFTFKVVAENSETVTIDGNTFTMPASNVTVIVEKEPEPEPAKVTSIEIVNPPKKVEYTAGDLLELAGLEVKLIFDNGDEKVVTYSPDNFKANNLSTAPELNHKLAKSDTNITISYRISDSESLSVSQEITVSEPVTP